MSLYAESLVEDASELLESCRSRGRKIATAESCTGGLICGLLTEIAGSSDVFDRGFVTYSNEAKQTMLEVDPLLLDAHGAVSAQVAGAMAYGALTHSMADLVISVTGIAGPGGGSAAKPVGTVYFGLAHVGHVITDCQIFKGDRCAVRFATVAHAIKLLKHHASCH